MVVSLSSLVPNRIGIVIHKLQLRFLQKTKFHDESPYSEDLVEIIFVNEIILMRSIYPQFFFKLAKFTTLFSFSWNHSFSSGDINVAKSWQRGKVKLLLSNTN